MLHNTQFIQDFMAHYEYPEEAVRLFTEVLEKLDTDKAFGEAFDLLKEKFDHHLARLNDKILVPLTFMAKFKGISPYTLHFVFLLCLTEDLKRQYTLLGINEKYYWDTMADLKFKLMECIECKEVPGTFVAGWYDGFFRLDRIAYGRFQYELSDFGEDQPYVMKNGKVVNPGDLVIGFHIPSSGVPLTDEVRLASYKEAYAHLKDMFPDGNVLFGCGSWLLYPKYKEFLPSHLNILKFIDDFDIVKSHESEKFGDAWRVFGKYADLPAEKLPQDTTLRKAFAEWLKSGGKTGGGYGLILFDGEKILK